MELIFLPCAGFGNRMRSMASAMVAAEEVGRPLRIIWTAQHNIFVGAFAKIFRGNFPPWVTIEDCADPNHYWLRAKLVKNEVEWLALKGEPVIKSYYAFYKEGTPRWLEHLRSFQFVPEFHQKYESIVGDYRPIGVHIRRTDNERAIKFSPSSEFWREMAEHPGMFYVASDSEEERVAAMQRFPGRILIGPTRILGRNNSGCFDAVLDFYCLSRCSTIIGSYYSSFSEVASQYGGSTLKIIHQV